MTKDDDRDIDTCEHTKLMRLLEQATFALQERDATISVIFDGFYLNLATTHVVCKGVETPQYYVSMVRLRKDDTR